MKKLFIFFGIVFCLGSIAFLLFRTQGLEVSTQMSYDASGEYAKKQLQNRLQNCMEAGSVPAFRAVRAKAAAKKAAPKPTSVPKEVRMARKILSRILHADWSKKQKLRAIYRYIQSEYSYINEEYDPRNWRKAARKMMRYKAGDCFGFYAISRLLIAQTGIRNKKVTYKDAAGKKHYVLLVFCNGKWNRFDPLIKSKNIWN